MGTMKYLPIIQWLLIILIPQTVSASEVSGAIYFPFWSAAFFIGLLLSIAIFPLINAEWWGKGYGYVSLALAIPAAILVLLQDWLLLYHVIKEYISFIMLLGSLFIISGGIVIKIGARGTPKLNLLLLFVGAVFASIIGTTGASMVLIRPLIRANKWRKQVIHIFVFFIFMVSNIGGLLTPLGDPPLLLGFLRGVPFFWTLKLIPFWLFAVLILLALFFVIDKHFMKKESQEDYLKTLDRMPKRKFEIKGMINLLFLAMVIGSLFIPPILREAVMLIAAGLSIYFTHVTLREENAFTYHPIIEVAILFAGIFITMAPVLKLLEINGSRLGVTEPWQFFWASGFLSGFLDNAPAYMVFFTTAQSVAAAKGIVSNLIMGVPEIYLKAISVGTVFMGANSYIGNGPNFMVKAICEENEINMPSFFGYMAWSVGILAPLFILMTFIFF
jgi:Na+/H+ antiporter NhaD/arsenite permease-like protein